MFVDTFLMAYRVWLESNGHKNMEDSYILQMLTDNFILDRKTKRVDGKPTSRRYIKSVLPDTMNAINLLLEGGSLEPAKEDVDVLEGD